MNTSPTTGTTPPRSGPTSSAAGEGAGRVPVVQHIPGEGDLGYTFGGRDPVLTVDPGTVLRTWTQDCFGGAVMTAQDLPSQVCDFARLNPVTGPFHITGAEPGDTLAVHLLELAPARGWAVSTTFPHFGALTSTHTTATLQPPLPEWVWIYQLDHAAGTARYRAVASDHAVDLPLAPMIGTIGVAPATGQVHASTVNGPHGGNLDSPLIRAGTTVYLPVNLPGALLSLGDGHARQGDGEACGTGIESAMDVVLAIDLVKNTPIPGIRLQTDTHLASIGCARPLEDAYRTAHVDLTGWISELTGLSTLDAYQLLSQTGTAPIGNVCDRDYTVAATIPTAVLHALGAREALDGVHHRLAHLATVLGPDIGRRRDT